MQGGGQVVLSLSTDALKAETLNTRDRGQQLI